MKKTISLLIATTGLTAVLAMPAWSAFEEAINKAAQAEALTSDAPQGASPLMQLSDNDADDDNDHEGNSYRSKHDDDDEGEDDDCDEAKTCADVGNPSRAGDAAPPANGLFGDGKAPKVDVN